ncbi:MAG: DnaB-like helicase C-terminal domain-containing protein [Ignavibacteriales bacterium]|nr:DnaB-like helicase C-terminal domain-containing protein [Ignavibacteriales bacterium]
MLTKEERNHLELSLLASLFSSEYCLTQILTVRYEALFSNPIHELIYDNIKKYYFEKNRPPSAPSQIYEMCLLENKSIPTKIISNIAQYELTSDVIKLADKLIEDDLQIKINKVQNEAVDKKIFGFELAHFLSEEINKSILKAEGYIKHEPNNIDLTENLLQKIKRNKSKDISEDYIKTEIEALDNKIIGIPKGHITIIAARPGQGKTAFMLQLMRNTIKKGLQVGIISIEMEAEALMLRNLSALSEVDSMKLESGSITDEEFNKMIKLSKGMIQDNYTIDESSYQTAETIKAKISKWRIQKKIDIVFIDYLTLISTKNKYQRFDLEIGSLTGDLRTFAKETKIPIVILSQLNRGVESRTNKKPILSDLRESGSIEQDAKTVLFLYRPSVYGINPFENGKHYVDVDGNLISDDEYLEVIISKARNGRIGTVPLRYIPKYHKFISAISANTMDPDNNKFSNGNWYERQEDFPI